MKKFFYVVWFGFSLVAFSLVLLFMRNNVSAGSLLATATVSFYSFCFFKLIRSAYPSEILLENSRIGFWIAWLLLPPAVLFCKNGLEIIMGGTYEPSGTRSRLLKQLMVLLGELAGAWLPGTIILLFGLTVTIFCIKTIHRRIVR